MDPITIASLAVGGVAAGRNVLLAVKGRALSRQHQSAQEEHRRDTDTITQQQEAIAQLERERDEALLGSASIDAIEAALYRTHGQHIPSPVLAKWLTENIGLVSPTQLGKALIESGLVKQVAGIIAQNEEAMYRVFQEGRHVVPDPVYLTYVKAVVKANDRTGHHVWANSQHNTVKQKKHTAQVITQSCELCGILRREVNLITAAEATEARPDYMTALADLEGWFLGGHRLTKEECAQPCCKLKST